MSYENFRKLMFEKNVIKADVIRATGVTRPTLVNWERGRTEPSVKTLKRLADYFGVPVSKLLD